MKSIKYLAILAGTVMLTFSSCDKYLDELPDDRAELNDVSKITNLLVSAYPTVTTNLVAELMSDNVADNGRRYDTTILMEELYRMKDPTEESNDSPYHIWGGFYESVATANQALEAIEQMGDIEELRARKAEAQLVRAYSMFQLANIFCMSYRDDKADEFLGLPYPKAPENDIRAGHVRGTLRELYENINNDIEEALPYIDDDYTTPKYHFTRSSAYAFAARFNLYYMKYNKVIEYANVVLGNDPTVVMRDFSSYTELGRVDIGNKWIMSTESANLLLLTAYSTSGRYLCGGSSPRFHHNSAMASYETFWVDMPWGSGSSNNTLYYGNKLYGTDYAVSFPTLDEQFEYTDKVNGIGYPHIVDPVFTGDQTLLERAEAYALLGRYQEAVDDINTWMSTHCKAEEGTQKRPTMTIKSINEFIEGLDYAPVVIDGNRDRSMRKVFNPQGFTVEEGTQENILQYILHMRRLETLYHGHRFCDVKRYGIEFCHRVAGEDPVVFTAGDLRGAVQLPSTVIEAGLEQNPRELVNQSNEDEK